MSFNYDATLPTGVPLRTTSRIWRTEWFVPSRHSHNHLDYKRCHNHLNQISFLELQLLQLACDEIPPHFGRSPAILERKNCFHWWYHPWVFPQRCPDAHCQERRARCSFWWFVVLGFKLNRDDIIDVEVIRSIWAEMMNKNQFGNFFWRTTEPSIIPPGQLVLKSLLSMSQSNPYDTSHCIHFENASYIYIYL